MAKAFSVAHLLHGKEPFLRHVVCEVRFQDGQLYLDHTGRLLKKLVCDQSWVIGPDLTSKGTTVFHLVEGYQLSFSLNAASLELNRSNTDEVIESEEADRFVATAEEVLGFVLDELEITRFSRLGFRQWYFFSFDSKDETEEWLRDLQLFPFCPDLVKTFQAEPEAMGVSLFLKGQDRHYRIALNGIERSAQLPMGDTTLNVRASSLPERQRDVLLATMKRERQRQINSSYAGVLDIDTYRKEPRELDLSQFLKDCMSENLDRFRNAIPREPDKKGT